MTLYTVTRMHRATRTYSRDFFRASNARAAVQMSRMRFPNDVRHTARLYRVGDGIAC